MWVFELLLGIVHTIYTFTPGAPYLKLAVGSLLAEYSFHTYLNLRQRRTVMENLKEGASKLFFKVHSEQSRAHSIRAKDLALVKGAVDLVESIAVVTFMVPAKAWTWSQQTVHAINPSWSANEYCISMVFVMLTLVFETVKGVPWSLYGTFVLEKRQGNKIHLLIMFFTDLFMSLALMGAVMPAILICFVYILRLPGVCMPLYLWAFISCLQMLFMTVYPTLVAPLFDTYTPLESGSLRTGIENLAGSLGFPLDKLYVMDGSKRSGHSNAFMYGFGRNKCIVLYDTLLKQCSEPQVVAVLAHELGHWKLGHTTRLMCIQQLIMLAQFTLFAIFRDNSHLLEDFGFVDTKPVIVSITLFMTMIGPVDKLVTWLFNLLSRRFEFQADQFAVDMQHSKHLSEALMVLDRCNMSDPVMDPLYSQYHCTHPPIAERLHAIDKKSR